MSSINKTTKQASRTGSLDHGDITDPKSIICVRCIRAMAADHTVVCDFGSHIYRSCASCNHSKKGCVSVPAELRPRMVKLVQERMKLATMTGDEVATHKWSLKRIAQELVDALGPETKTPRATTRLRGSEDKGADTPTKKGARGGNRGGATRTRSISVMGTAEDDNLMVDDDMSMYDDNDDVGMSMEPKEHPQQRGNKPEQVAHQHQHRPQPLPLLQSQPQPKPQQQQHTQRKGKQTKQRQGRVDSVDLTDGHESPRGSTAAMFSDTNRALYGIKKIGAEVEHSKWLATEFKQIHQSDELLNKDVEVMAGALVVSNSISDNICSVLTQKQDIRDLLTRLVNALVNEDGTLRKAGEAVCNDRMALCTRSIELTMPQRSANEPQVVGEKREREDDVEEGVNMAAKRMRTADRGTAEASAGQANQTETNNDEEMIVDGEEQRKDANETEDVILLDN